MSGPVVAIGYILLIPSILGMLACSLVFLRIITLSNPHPSVASEHSQTSQDAFDQNFRRNCEEAFDRVYEQTIGPPNLRITADYCECALSAYKETHSELTARQICREKYADGTIAASLPEIQRLYVAAMDSTEKQEREPSAGFSIIPVIGSGLAIALGIAFFVSGLLGWLLVMKKRVLQCSMCGAVINAS
jgi:hypothetical protein